MAFPLLIRAIGRAAIESQRHCIAPPGSGLLFSGAFGSAKDAINGYWIATAEVFHNCTVYQNVAYPNHYLIYFGETTEAWSFQHVSLKGQRSTGYGGVRMCRRQMSALIAERVGKSFPEEAPSLWQECFGQPGGRQKPLLSVNAAITCIFVSPEQMKNIMEGKGI